MDSPEIEISVVIPVFNSSMIIPELLKRTIKTMNELDVPYEIILVEDCGTDDSWDIIKKFSYENAFIKGLRMSKNYGQWITTLAGMSFSKGAYIVTMDDDLEYEPTEIKKL